MYEKNETKANLLPQLIMLWPPALLQKPPQVELVPGYSLRTYQKGDEAGFYKLMELAGWPGWDDVKLAPWLARIPPQSWYLIQHEATGEIVASTMGIHDHTDWHPFGAEIGWVAASPAHAGKGLGKAVCSAVIARLIAAGYTNIHLYTESERLAALKIYLSLGYVPYLYESEMRTRWQTVCKQLHWAFTPELWYT